MDTLSVALLPLILAFIMFALGLSMQIADIKYIAKEPKAFIIGFISQLVLLPVITLILILLLEPAPAFAFGFMLLSFCPGGVTSNMLCTLLKGNLPLSVALTSVMSLVSIFTVPVLTAWAYGHFLGTQGGSINLVSMGIKMFFITALPVGLGILMHEKKPEFTRAHRDKFMKVAFALFVILVAVAIFSNREVLFNESGQITVMIVTLLIALFIVGLGIPKLLGLSWRDAKTIGMEVGIQNSSMALALSGILAVSSDSVLPAFALPAAVYSVVMYLVAVPYIWVFRKFND